MRALELLAPAKNLECGKAAIDHGADAVYMGPPMFGARAAAGNSLDDMGELCRYAHQYGAKVYATVNTLLHDDELPQAFALLEQLAEVGADAVLIQDMRLLATQAPIVLHASTQADNRTAEKVQWLAEQGFSRAVLARELSIGEIDKIHRRVPQMELEVFVHGALCVSYSGRCYASEHCFGRSANRGECAQFCRMQFDLLDGEGRELLHQRHLLSLRDLNMSRHIGQLIEVGATSFKIEGRLKDVGYVKNVTAAYSQLIDRYIAEHPGQYERSSRGHCRYTFEPDLQRTFNRGYTTYFAHGRQGGMANFLTPKALGQQVGKVKALQGRSFTVSGTASFANGDGLCFFDAQQQLQGFRVNRAEGNLLFPQTMPAALRPGQMLYRSSDQAMERMLAGTTATRKIPLTMRLRATDDGFALSIDGGPWTTMAIEHQQARTPQRENIVRELTKLGNTPYECSSVELPQDFNYFIPASQLAALRRKSLTPGPSPKGEGSIYSQGQNQGKSLYTPLSNRRGAGGEATPLSNRREAGGEATPLSNGRGVGGEALMHCRYCLRHELGYCVKHGGSKPTWREPLYLRLGDGRRFRLEFDCKRCEMKVYADEKD